MNIMLGHLSVEEMQVRSEVKFPLELTEYMRPRNQPKAEGVESGKWHCFDVPFELVCGDMETATEIYRHLSPLSRQFKEPMKISIERSTGAER